MNGLGKPVRNPIQKIERTVNIEVKTPHVNEKPLRESDFFFKHRFLTPL